MLPVNPPDILQANLRLVFPLQRNRIPYLPHQSKRLHNHFVAMAGKDFEKIPELKALNKSIKFKKFVEGYLDVCVLVERFKCLPLGLGKN